ncbi:hypothetical protein TNCV_2651431 [Trichonephila clavipes]|nr:hypothetical protein TNCV_2651431 [Trichonephila clavipes]
MRVFGDGPKPEPLLTTTTPTGGRFTKSVHRCPTRRVFSGTGLELVTKPATIRCLYHSATAATVRYERKKGTQGHEKSKQMSWTLKKSVILEGLV